jgi:hypothetical protein
MSFTVAARDNDYGVYSERISKYVWWCCTKESRLLALHLLKTLYMAWIFSNVIHIANMAIRYLELFACNMCVVYICRMPLRNDAAVVLTLLSPHFLQLAVVAGNSMVSHQCVTIQRAASRLQPIIPLRFTPQRTKSRQQDERDPAPTHTTPYLGLFPPPLLLQLSPARKLGPGPFVFLVLQLHGQQQAAPAKEYINI